MNLLITLNTRPLQRNTRTGVREKHIVPIAGIHVVVCQLSRARLDAALTERSEVEVRVVEVEAKVVVFEDWWGVGGWGGASRVGRELLYVPFLGGAGLGLALGIGDGEGQG